MCVCVCVCVRERERERERESTVHPYQVLAGFGVVCMQVSPSHCFHTHTVCCTIQGHVLESQVQCWFRSIICISIMYISCLLGLGCLHTVYVTGDACTIDLSGTCNPGDRDLGSWKVVTECCRTFPTVSPTSFPAHITTSHTLHA